MPRVGDCPLCFRVLLRSGAAERGIPSVGAGSGAVGQGPRVFRLLSSCPVKAHMQMEPGYTGWGRFEVGVLGQPKAFNGAQRLALCQLLVTPVSHQVLCGGVLSETSWEPAFGGKRSVLGLDTRCSLGGMISAVL